MLSIVLLLKQLLGIDLRKWLKEGDDCDVIFLFELRCTYMASLHLLRHAIATLFYQQFQKCLAINSVVKGQHHSLSDH